MKPDPHNCRHEYEQELNEMADFKNKVEIEGVFVKAETAKALLCVIDGKEHWIPQSQIDDDSEVWQKDDEGTLIISEWIATEKGLI